MMRWHDSAIRQGATLTVWAPLERTALIGRRVIVHGRWRTIVATYPDIRGGVILDKPVDGFRCWNLDDMRFEDTAK